VPDKIRHQRIDDVAVDRDGSDCGHSHNDYSANSVRFTAGRLPVSLLVMITHIKFVSVPTTDQDRALAFYTEKLGFRLLTDQPSPDQGQRWIELRLGSSETHFVLFSAESGPKPGFSFNGALACDNVERTYQELTARGVDFTSPPQKEPWGTFAMFKDPDGNAFVLSSRG
jgi:catechol 2,3-dioxygenase-like lactoylglutathione lyase family enzyme